MTSHASESTSKHTVYRVLSIVQTVFMYALAAAIIIAAILFAASNSPNNSFFGYRFYTVLTPSMESELSMVKVFPIERELIEGSTNTYRIVKGSTAITDADTLVKLQGDTQFTYDDLDYYYMTYYWRLQDGRFLSDERLVTVQSKEHKVNLITGVTSQGRTDVIPSFVSDDATICTTLSPADWTNLYGTPTATKETLTFADMAYVCEVRNVITESAATLTAWYQTDPNYILSELIIECKPAGSCDWILLPIRTGPISSWIMGKQLLWMICV